MIFQNALAEASAAIDRLTTDPVALAAAVPDQVERGTCASILRQLARQASELADRLAGDGTPDPTPPTTKEKR